MTNKVALEKILQRATEKCAESGSRLTDKRSRILSILVESKAPLSAYEVVDRYNVNATKSMPPMSAYRILDYLVSEELVHKLSSENKYIACSHIVCCDDHQVSQFLICKQCSQVKEIVIQRDIIENLKKHVVDVGYQLTNYQLELECVCEDCASSS